MDPNTSDIYICYGFDVTTTTKRHAVHFAPRIDNPRILHHMILFQSDAAESTTPSPCNIQNSLQWRIQYGWAPGGKPLDTPAAAGFPLQGTTHYVVQIHYNNVNHLSGQTDATGVDLCTTDVLRPNDADTVAFGTTQITVNPHQTLDETCNWTVPTGVSGLHAFAAFPHMHQIGKLIDTNQIPGGTGTPVDMGNQPNWDFQNQIWFNINATINAGDVISTRCVWTNSGTQVVNFGEYTSDEMCFSFTMYYPRLSSLPSWIYPSYQSTCHIN
jgi:hypothetical protein